MSSLSSGASPIASTTGGGGGVVRTSSGGAGTGDTLDSSLQSRPSCLAPWRSIGSVPSGGGPEARIPHPPTVRRGRVGTG